MGEWSKHLNRSIVFVKPKITKQCHSRGNSYYVRNHDSAATFRTRVLKLIHNFTKDYVVYTEMLELSGESSHII